MDWLHFLNLQYWYCVVYSFFGGNCTYLDELRATGVNVPFDRVSAGEQIGFFQRVGEGMASMFSSVWGPIEGIITFIWSMYSAIAWSISAFLFFAILSAFLGLVYIRTRELYTYGTVPLEEKGNDPYRARWDELLEMAKSTNPKLWRDSILEADRMLGKILGDLGYKGINTAEKMRNLPEDAFVTVPTAWEAHRVRNFVSQETSDFILTQREAFRVLKLYEQVFEEFNIV